MQLFILGFSTPHQAHLLECWSGWMNAMMATPSDAANITYSLIVESANSPARGLIRRLIARLRGTRGENDEWRAALRQKVSFVRRTITDLAARHPACPHDCAFLFSDLDVLPLRPYAELVRHLKRALLIFMREPQQSSAGYVNSGFYLLRPLPPVLTFLRDWANSFTADHYNDQHLANALLWKWDGNTSAPPVDVRNVDFGHAFSRWGLRWKAFPASLVSGHADDLARGTVAFHGVFNVGVERKLQVLQKIALKARGWRRHVKLRTCVPPPSAEPSILPPGHACAAEPRHLHYGHGCSTCLRFPKASCRFCRVQMGFDCGCACGNRSRVREK